MAVSLYKSRTTNYECNKQRYYGGKDGVPGHDVRHVVGGKEGHVNEGHTTPDAPRGLVVNVLLFEVVTYTLTESIIERALGGISKHY